MTPLSTIRPYRDAWLSERTMRYLESAQQQSSILVAVFIRTLRDGEAQVRVLSSEPLSA